MKDFTGDFQLMLLLGLPRATAERVATFGLSIRK